MKYKDYYSALGLERGATDDQIKKAYRRLARKYHPDVPTINWALTHLGRTSSHHRAGSSSTAVRRSPPKI